MLEQITLLLTVVGALVFIVSLVTQVLKNIPFLDKLPTNALVFILSIAVSIAAMFAYASYASLIMTWYFIAGAIVAGFIVAYVSMFGWDKLNELWQRSKKPTE